MAAWETAQQNFIYAPWCPCPLVRSARQKCFSIVIFPVTNRFLTVRIFIQGLGCHSNKVTFSQCVSCSSFTPPTPLFFIIIPLSFFFSASRFPHARCNVSTIMYQMSWPIAATGSIKTYAAT